jgi:hydrogenase nickel incorporation protein HypB
VLNLVSSPGSGKTTLLTETLTPERTRRLRGDRRRSANGQRRRAHSRHRHPGDSGQYRQRLPSGCADDCRCRPRLPLADNGILFIENVGNLVCPASFDLGERHKVAVLSVTEGEDKPLKYPHMFAAASLMLLNKVDLLPYLNFDVDKCLACAREVNPDIEILLVSATSGEGMDQWLNWLETQRCA